MNTEVLNQSQFKPDTNKNDANGEQPFRLQRLPEALNTQKDEAEAEKAAMQVTFISNLLNKIISSKTK